MELRWSERSWEDYLYLQGNDRRTLEKLHKLIKDVQRHGEAEGLGSPEPLKGDLAGYWSRELNKKDRFVYRITEDGCLYIAQCRTHYRDK